MGRNEQGDPMTDLAASASPVTAPPAAPPIDLEAIKKRQQATWASGQYGVIGTTLQIVGETLCEAADVHAGERVLDAACGNGNAALAAARRFADVTGLDYVPALLELAARRAAADGLPLTVQEGDVEALPFADASFDAVLSVFGCMFAPDHARTASELLRVCRPGGRVAVASWTPESFVGGLFRMIGRLVPPPKGVASPALWGKEDHLREIFPGTSMTVSRRRFVFRYLSAQHFVDVFRAYYGPVHRAFAALQPAEQAILEADLLALLNEHNRATDGTLVVAGEYLEAVIVKP
jgi:ubiquinone/menaquinone biosynthesis C-methylase UbiE